MREEYIPITELQIGQAYELDARNIRIGIWDGAAFHGVREKFGDTFMDTENHYDTENHATAKPIRVLK